VIQIGQVISGKYKLLRLLGDGGMGSVYEAQHEVLGTRVAIKVLHADLARRPGLIERFLQEARVAAQIDSANVVRVSDVDRTPDGIAYLVMELLQGEPLSAVLERDRKVPITTAVEYTRQILSALEAAHALGVTHRDLKPENVFVTFAGGKPVVKIIDFGIAKLRTPSTTGRSLTVAGITMGTAEYMAPEQAFSADKADARSDIYAVGVMLYELIAGDRPVSGDDARVIAVKVERGEVKPLVHAAPDVPRELAGLVHRAMAARPDLRFQTASDMRIALEAVKLSPPSPGDVKKATSENPRPPTAALAAAPQPQAAQQQAAPQQAVAQQAQIQPNLAPSVAPEPRAHGTVMAAPLAMDAYGAPPNTERPAQPMQQPQYGNPQSPYANGYGASAQTDAPTYGAPPPRKKKGGGWLLIAIPILLGIGVVVTIVIVQSQSTPDTPQPLAIPVDTTQTTPTQTTAQNPTQNPINTGAPVSTQVAPLLTGGPTQPQPHPTTPGHPGTANPTGTGTSNNPPTLPFPSGFPTTLPSGLPFPLPTMNIPSSFPTAFPFPTAPTAPTAAPTTSATSAPATSSTSQLGL
jgi:serine/threonine protein kinase